MVINALSYGTIIPLLYPYAAKFGMTAPGLAVLFASFSVAQFIATPLMGRLSDVHGRKPLLVISIGGTALSLALFASATSIPLLFLARILDGITGGNASIAQAIIADTTKPAERAQAFGILGAAFGFGFVFGPALATVTSGISLTAPFWIASGLALLATLATIIFLPETNTKREKRSSAVSVLSPKVLFGTLRSPVLGKLFLVLILAFVGQHAMIIAFQSFTVDTLKMNAQQISMLFTAFGLVNVLIQGGGIKFLMQRTADKLGLAFKSLLLATGTMLVVAAWQSFWPFVIFILLYGAIFAITAPLLTSIISERTNAEDQGGIMGLSQAYQSLAQVFGPLAAAALLLLAPKWVFVFTALCLAVAAVILRREPAQVAASVDL